MRTIRNRDRLRRKLQAVPKAVRREVHGALQKSADEISGMQKRLVPVDSGDLQRSIGYTFGEYRADNASVRGVSGATVGIGDPDLTVILHAGDEKAFYAAFIELGTSGPYEIKGKFAGTMHPGLDGQPYFYPPVRASKRRVKSRISRAVTKGIKTAVQQNGG